MFAPPKVLAELGDVAEELNGSLGDMVTIAAQHYETRWKQIVPVDTGRYKRSIRIESWYERGPTRHSRRHCAAVGTDIGADGELPPYPIYLEFGTSKMPPYPSAGPAWRDTLQAMEHFIVDEANRVLRNRANNETFGPEYAVIF